MNVTRNARQKRSNLPPMPRRRKPAAERKTEVIRVLVTKEQRAELQAAADRKEIDLSTWIRQTALEIARAK